MLLQLVLNGLVNGSIYGLMAVGFALIFAVARIFHLAHGLVYLAAAYCAYYLSVYLKLNLILIVILTVFLAIGLGTGIEVLVYRYLRRKGASGHIIMIASLATLILGANMVAAFSGTLEKRFEIFQFQPTLVFGGLTITPLHLFDIVLFLVVFSSVVVFLKFTSLGKKIRAVADNPSMAELTGIDSSKVYLWTFVISSALAAPAGILVGIDLGCTPDMGMTGIMIVFVAVIVGGAGSLLGAGLGSMFIGIIESVGVWKIQSGWAPAITYTVLLLFITLRPKGFLGRGPDVDI
jgi:branched-chain amino acid transport system permease protein